MQSLSLETEQKSNYRVDFSRNPKQEQFFNDAIDAALGNNEYRELFYGGAIRGGKTFVCLAALTTYCKIFAGSKWVIIREDLPKLQTTTIPSLEKIIGNLPGWGWNRNVSNYFAYHKKSDSKIFFKSENAANDPDCDWLKGFELNGILYEQIEEIKKKTYEIGKSRLGSLYLPKMPKPILLATFNPTQTWIKDYIYTPFMEGKLQAPLYYLNATPKDNAFVTEDQWAVWGGLADRYQQQYIEGNWTDFDNQDNRWAFAYSPAKHTWKPEGEQVNKAHPVYLSFDFNVNPMCCAVIQHYDNCIYVLRLIKLPNSGTKQICEHIEALYPGCLFMVTGDATGRARRTDQVDNMHNYIIIRNALRLSNGQIQVPASNPPLERNKTLVNSLLATYDVKIHKEDAAALHFDMQNVHIHPDGKIIKEDRTDPTQQADALDTFRYFCNTFMSWYIKDMGL